MPKPQAVTDTQVRYEIDLKCPACFDDGFCIEHDQWYIDSTQTIEATTDKEAQLATLLSKYHQEEHCRHGRKTYPAKLRKIVTETTADGFSRITTTDLPFPQIKRCVCGKTYVPLRDEAACHEVVPVKAAV
jgi:hypothetical protein